MAGQRPFGPVRSVVRIRAVSGGARARRGPVNGPGGSAGGARTVRRHAGAVAAAAAGETAARPGMPLR